MLLFKKIIGIKFYHAYLIATIIYLLIASAVLFSANLETFVKHAADSDSWTKPAQGFSENLAFVDPDDPSRPMNYRPPVYPLFVGFFMIVAGSLFPMFVVLIQLLLHFATSFVTARIVEYVEPGMGVVAFSLMLFNPNSFATAFFVQSETLNTFLLVLVILGLILFARQSSIYIGGLIGIIVGLAALTRTEGQFLIILVPLLIVIIWAVGQTRMSWRGGTTAAIFCLVLSLAVTAPWMTWNYNLGDGYRTTSSGSTSYFVWGNATQIEMEQFSVSAPQAEKRVLEERNFFIKSQGNRWNELDSSARDNLLVEAGFRHIMSYDFTAIAKTFFKSTFLFFTTGGAGKWFKLMGEPSAAPFAVMVREAHSSYFESVLSALKQSNPLLFSIWLIAIGFVICTRIVGLIGLMRLFFNKHYDVLLICVAGIGFYSLVMPFYGISRFRVNVECLLMVLAVSGISALLKTLKNS
jgi:hypothetical protein